MSPQEVLQLADSSFSPPFGMQWSLSQHKGHYFLSLLDGASNKEAAIMLEMEMAEEDIKEKLRSAIKNLLDMYVDVAVTLANLAGVDLQYHSKIYNPTTASHG